MAWSDIKGQEKAVSFLKGSIEKSQISQAYLFVGIDGVGKSLAAGEFARALNCFNGKSEGACGECFSCTEIDAGEHPDIIRICPEKKTSVLKIDLIRNLKEKLSLKPYRARYRVCIIEDADLMNAEASNAILKILEEPPANTVFVLTSFSERALFSTIVSRCTKVRFACLDEEVMGGFLERKFGADKNTVRSVVRMAQGSLGRAEKLYEGGLLERRKVILDRIYGGKEFGSLEWDHYEKDLLLEDIDILVGWCRDLIVFSETGGTDGGFYNEGTGELLKEKAGSHPAVKINEIMEKLIEYNHKLQRNTNPKLVMAMVGNLIGEFRRY